MRDIPGLGLSFELFLQDETGKTLHGEVALVVIYVVALEHRDRGVAPDAESKADRVCSGTHDVC